MNIANHATLHPLPRVAPLRPIVPCAPIALRVFAPDLFVVVWPHVVPLALINEWMSEK